MKSSPSANFCQKQYIKNSLDSSGIENMRLSAQNGRINAPKSIDKETISLLTIICFFIMRMQFYLSRVNGNVLKDHKIREPNTTANDI